MGLTTLILAASTTPQPCTPTGTASSSSRQPHGTHLLLGSDQGHSEQQRSTRAAGTWSPLLTPLQVMPPAAATGQATLAALHPGPTHCPRQQLSTLQQAGPQLGSSSATGEPQAVAGPLQGRQHHQGCSQQPGATHVALMVDTVTGSATMRTHHQAGGQDPRPQTTWCSCGSRACRGWVGPHPQSKQLEL
jgi:hypothetical protein